MLKKLLNNIKKKSLRERFLLVLGIFFFLLYFVLGLFIIFMKNFPLEMGQVYRVVFGIILILYASFRFFRIINDNYY
ncbi:hypothetical protein DR980_15050 [Flavobacterium psychrolimnae]|uniref:CPBP family intramembrane metalloprotease n=1 Tax=Flavobacterium psychrolimnae TaxID=249351 RepID=A0A366AWF6_9FLAO|nr:hypothetical protein DR980_15050 [Flavobacterium psychrolimnae]